MNKAFGISHADLAAVLRDACRPEARRAERGAARRFKGLCSH